jgi:hypothetical protein
MVPVPQLSFPTAWADPQAMSNGTGFRSFFKTLLKFFHNAGSLLRGTPSPVARIFR